MTDNLTTSKVKSLRGKIKVPGDKSLSHRSLMFSAIALGESKITGILEGEDVIATKDALVKLGCNITKQDNHYIVNGVGIKGLSESASVLDMGNSGTAARLMMGLVASYNFNTIFTGDASLCKRPMQRVTEPLQLMGADFVTRSGGRLPLAVIGASELMPITYEMKVASAQVKSAIILAAIGTAGTTTIIENEATRDHTELMLKHLGADINVQQNGSKGKIIIVNGLKQLHAKDIVVPSDPSSAAFFVVAALITEDSEVTLQDVCLNKYRTGLYEVLKLMGADITISNVRTQGVEEVGDITAKSSKLKAIDVPADIAPSMIDEFPILAIAAACAEGATRMHNLAELKVKESNRLAAMESNLSKCGIKCEIGEDSLIVHGTQKIAGDVLIETHMDHRIAMSFLILGLVTDGKITVNHASMINTSFPGFMNLLDRVKIKS